MRAPNTPAKDGKQLLNPHRVTPKGPSHFITFLSPAHAIGYTIPMPLMLQVYAC